MRLRIVVVIGTVAVITAGGGSSQAAAGRSAAPRGATASVPVPTMGALISGTTSIVKHTQVWTDYAYDDHGRAGCNPIAPTVDAAIWPVSRVPDTCEPTYPAAAAPGNAADLIQLQLRPAGGGVAIRAVLETLTDAKVPLLGVGFDLDANPATGSRGVPGGEWTVAGTPLGLERMVLISSAGARVLAWTGTQWQEVGTVPAQVRADDNTMSATIPAGLLGPSGPTWRAVGMLGLGLPGYDWSKGQGPLYDLAFVTDPSRQNWQSNLQGAILAGQDDAAKAVARIDIASLARSGDVLAAPTPGDSVFLYHSALNLGEGIQAAANSQYAGPYQPYGLWIPERLSPHPGIVVAVHGAMSNHVESAYGDGAPFETVGPITVIGSPSWRLDAVIVSPLARGSGYDGPAEQDELDVIADALRRFHGDPDRVVMTGGSLGGVHTFRMAELYPDMFAGALETVGANQLGEITIEEQAQGQQTLPNAIENLRNLPFRMSNSRLDEIELAVGAVQPDLAAMQLQQLGYDYRYWQFLHRGHQDNPANLALCQVKDLLARGRVRDPAEVVYSEPPAIQTQDPKTGLDQHHDHAYWMSGLVPRGTFKPGDKATVDITSLARADRTPAKTQILGVHEDISQGYDTCGPTKDDTTRQDAWYETGIAWSPGPKQPTSNAIKATLTRVASVTLAAHRMSIDVTKPVTLSLTSDGPASIRLTAPWRTAERVDTAGAPSWIAHAQGRTITVPIATGTHDITLTPAATPPTTRSAAHAGRHPTASPAAVVAPSGTLAATGIRRSVPLLGLGLLTSGMVLRRRRHSIAG